MKTSLLFRQLLWAPWTIWCCCWFILIVTTLFPLLVLVVTINHEPLIRWAHRVPPAAARLVLFIWGIRVKQKGVKDKIDINAQYIFVANHRSYLDALISSSVVPNYVKFLGKGEVTYWPILGYLLTKFYVPVWRDDKEHRQWSMEQMADKLKTGASFFIFPEGTCNTTTDFLKFFHNGAYRLAVEHQLPLLPLTFVGCAELFPRKGFMIKPGTVTVYWDNPIPTQGLSSTAIESLKQQTMQVMETHLRQHYPTGNYTSVE